MRLRCEKTRVAQLGALHSFNLSTKIRSRNLCQVRVLLTRALVNLITSVELVDSGLVDSPQT